MLDTSSYKFYNLEASSYKPWAGDQVRLRTIYSDCLESKNHKYSVQ